MLSGFLIWIDVFLTPLKPPTKASISLESIQSSLYYFHIETAEDDVLRQSIDLQKESEKMNAELPTIHRKPLPPTPYINFPPSLRPQPPPKSYPHYQPRPSHSEKDTQAERYAARGTNVQLSPRLDNGQTIPRRKPLGARPMNTKRSLEDLQTTDHSTIGRTFKDHGTGAEWQIPSRKPVSKSGVMVDRESVAISNETSESTEYAKDVLSASLSSSYNFANITLIRRDPASGAQWNVGTMNLPLDYQNQTSLAPVDIFLNGPGYSKFNNGNEELYKFRGPKSENTDPTARLGSEPAKLGFCRRVDFQALEDDERFKLQRRRTDPNDLSAWVEMGSTKRTRRHYSFASPWQGVCTFTNSADGRSLRCQHLLPNLNSAQEIAPVDVAELRFNLPWLFSNNRKHNEGSSNHENSKVLLSEVIGNTNIRHWRSSVQNLKEKPWVAKIKDRLGTENVPPPLPRRPMSNNDEVSEEFDHLNLGLGREKAGGGFRGESAKLGKLIIEDEGLKMCDLVVSACMGIWWQRYAA